MSDTLNNQIGFGLIVGIVILIVLAYTIVMLKKQLSKTKDFKKNSIKEN